MGKQGCATIRRTRAENAEFVIRSVKALGLEPNPTSRLMQMHQVLTGANGIITPDHPDFEAAVEAERDMQVFAFVFDQVPAHPNDTGFHRLIRTALKDSLLPQDDRTRSKGRDAQFELFVAAVCQSSGMLPVVREEPDVTCVVQRIKFGIAAKRVKSVASLEKRVRDAADQVRRTRLPGIIALDTCVALNRENQRITVPIPEEEFWRRYKQGVYHFIGEYHDRVQELVRGKGVLGLAIHDHQIRFQPNGEWTLESMTIHVSTARENQRRNREFATFARQYGKGLPNVEQL
jgi:hypothetical protein